MHVLLDTNIFISYLLSHRPTSPIAQVMTALFERRFVLRMPAELLEELVRTLIKKPYLKDRIRVAEAEHLVTQLSSLAESISPIAKKIPAITRDPTDDYLPAYAQLGQVDYLVTGDPDLLVLKRVGQVKIVSPRTFIARLKAA
jgi:putative PIN family toxin of toxin-antitoxin system